MYLPLMQSQADMSNVRTAKKKTGVYGVVTAIAGLGAAFTTWKKYHGKRLAILSTNQRLKRYCFLAQYGCFNWRRGTLKMP